MGYHNSSSKIIAIFVISLLFLLSFLIRPTTPLLLHNQLQPTRTDDADFQGFQIKKAAVFLNNNKNDDKQQANVQRKKKVVMMKKKKKKQRMMKSKLLDDERRFSAMLPKGYVPPSGSSPCHNAYPNSVTFFCDLSSAQP